MKKLVFKVKKVKAGTEIQTKAGRVVAKPDHFLAKSNIGELSLLNREDISQMKAVGASGEWTFYEKEVQA
jgi:hypothetical protein